MPKQECKWPLKAPNHGLIIVVFVHVLHSWQGVTIPYSKFSLIESILQPLNPTHILLLLHCYSWIYYFWLMLRTPQQSCSSRRDNMVEKYHVYAAGNQSGRRSALWHSYSSFIFHHFILMIELYYASTMWHFFCWS